MQRIVTDVVRSVVYLSVCLSVWWSRGCAVEKRLNRSRRHLRAESCGSKKPCTRWGSRLDESTHRREGWQVGNAAFCQIM